MTVKIYLSSLKVNTPEDTSGFVKDQKALEGVLRDYIQNGSKNFMKLDSDYWSSVKNRLLQSSSA